MRYLFVCLVTALLLPAAVAQDRSSEHARKTLEIYRTIIEIDTSKHTGNTPKVAKYLADELIAAGFAPEDVEVVMKPPFAALVARYRGNLSSGTKPILLLGHMDVVEANPEDWDDRRSNSPRTTSTSMPAAPSTTSSVSPN
jgi:acetylornithine deacetylase/succinyl-diaminopimelate desuccinylase-like protein